MGKHLHRYKYKQMHCLGFIRLVYDSTKLYIYIYIYILEGDKSGKVERTLLVIDRKQEHMLPFNYASYATEYKELQYLSILCAHLVHVG